MIIDMELLLNRKVLLTIIAFLLAIIAFFILNPKPPINTNGKGDKIPGLIAGANGAKEGIKKVVTYCFKQISSKRHVIQNLGKSSRPHSPLNTVVDKKVVNIVKDVKDINAGLAKRTGELFKLPNGNVYSAKSISNGANLFPVSGRGMYTLSRGQYNILRELKLKGGLTDDLYRWFNNSQIAKSELDLPLEIYKKVLIP